MLETEIKKLTEAVLLLNETLKVIQPGAFLVSHDMTDELVNAHAEAEKIIEQAKVDSHESEEVVEEPIHPNQQTLDLEHDEPIDTPTVPLTHDDLKEACLAKVREDGKFKVMIKQMLMDDFKAVKAVDVPSDQIENAIAKIEAMV